MEKILDELKKELKEIKDLAKLNELKAKYLGKKGSSIRAGQSAPSGEAGARVD